MSRPAAARFADVLRQRKHQLSWPEIQSLNVLLGEEADPNTFHIQACYVLPWNGRRVLAVVGVWLEGSIEMCKMYADASGDGSVVQEVYFFFPDKVAAAFRSDAEKALQSIQWINIAN